MKLYICWGEVNPPYDDVSLYRIHMDIGNSKNYLGIDYVFLNSSVGRPLAVEQVSVTYMLVQRGR